MKRKLSKILGIALTVAMLTSLMISASPALALTQPTVTIPTADSEISKVDADFNIRFSLATQLTSNATNDDTITVTFPAGTVLNSGTFAATIQAGPGWSDNGSGTIAYRNSEPANLNVGANWTVDAVALTAVWSGDNTSGTDVYIGEGAELRIDITAGVTQPVEAGTYALTVKTTKETTAVTSNSYTLTTPVLTALPGIVTAYNSASVAMRQDTKIDAAMVTAAGKDGKIELTAGTYTAIANLATEGIDVVGVGTVIFDSPVNITGKSVTLENITIKEKVGNIITVAGADCVLKNVTVKATTNAQAIIVAATAGGLTIDGCTIDAAKTIGVNSANATTIKNSTLTVTTGGKAINSVATLTVKDNTITGSSGTGIAHTSSGTFDGAVATVESNKFNTLDTAITFGGNSVVNASKNTFEGCGNASAAIVIAAGSTNTSSFTNNTIQNCNAKSYAFQVNNGVVNAAFNSILNNTLNVDRTAGTANFKLNWWGIETGAATTSIKGTVDVTAPLGAAPGTDTSARIAASSTISASTTAGVDISAVTAAGVASAMTEAGVSKLAANPEKTTPPIMGTGSVIGYWDIYVNPGVATDVLTIKIYSSSVSEYTKIYYGGGLSGLWTACTNQGINVAGGYAWFTTSGTSTPSTSDLKGTPFAMVTDKTLAAPAITAAAGGSPAIGAYDISVTPTFTWGAIAGADHYQINLCEDPSFTILEWAYNVDAPFFKADEALRNETTYYWRVRGVLDAASTAFTPWATGIFTTEAEEVAAETPITIDPVVPEVTVEIPPTKITVEPSAPAIPTYLLWIIVVVGAVLVIALIVLIVRTRRVA